MPTLSHLPCISCIREKEQEVKRNPQELKRGSREQVRAVKTISSPSKMHFLPLPADQTPILWDPSCLRRGPQALDMPEWTRASGVRHYHTRHGRTSSTDSRNLPLPLSWLRTTHSPLNTHHASACCSVGTTRSLPGTCYPFLFPSVKSSHVESWLRQRSLKPSLPAHAPPSLLPYCSSSLLPPLVLLLSHLEAPPGLHPHPLHLVCNFQHSAKYLACGRWYAS